MRVCSRSSAKVRFAASTKPTASFRLARVSRSVRPCVFAPGNSSTKPMYPSRTFLNTAVSFIVGLSRIPQHHITTRSLRADAGRFGDQFGEVADSHRFFQRAGLHRVFEHRYAKRASDCDALGLGLLQLIEALLIDARALVFFLPEASAAGAAAERAILRLLDLLELGAGDRTKRAASTVPFAIVARHVARVVIGDALGDLAARLQAPGLDELVDKLGFVQDRVVAAEVGILILQIVKAMRALRNYAPRLVAIESLDVLRGDGRVQVFVAEPARRVAGASLLASEDRKLDARLFHQARERLADALIALVVRSGASDPIQHVDLRRVLELGNFRNLQPGRPFGTLLLREAPRIALVLDSLERSRQLGRESRFHQHIVAPHIDDSLDVLDADRASLFAPSARRASPHRFFGRNLRDHVGAVPRGRFGRSGVTIAGVGFRSEQERGLVEQMLALFDHEKLGIERLAGVDCRAVDRTAAAFEARAHVEQLLPRVLLDLRDAEGDRVFEILDRREPSAWTHVAEKKIQRAENQMTQLGERKTEQQRVHAQHVHQPQPSMVSNAG